MSISVLDCTLRDGGCVNGFEFRNDVMRAVEDAVSRCGVQYIELGYLDAAKGSEKERSCFKDMAAYNGVFGDILREGRSLRYLMMDYGKFDPFDLPAKGPDTCDGIRLCFHRKKASEAVAAAKVIAEKGYSVFIQPMICTRYTDDEFRSLIGLIEKTVPEYDAFYIVDSFGEMDAQEVCARVMLADSVMSGGKKLGIHTHNNRGLCYEHAKAAAQLPLKRDLIIDGTLMGMGKGAGNLPLEHLTGLLDRKHGGSYDTDALNEVCGSYIAPLHKAFVWGECEEFLISARYSVTPSYVRMISETYSPDMGTLDDMISKIPQDKRDSFDREFAIRFCEEYLARREG